MAQINIPENILDEMRASIRRGVPIRDKAIPAKLYVIGPLIVPTPIKIGIAVDPYKRLRGLQCGSPVELVLHHVEEMGEIAQRFEGALHRALRSKRCHGEWFDITALDAVGLIQHMLGLLSSVSKARRRKGHVAD